jgi:hypothetical protein
MRLGEVLMTTPPADAGPDGQIEARMRALLRLARIGLAVAGGLVVLVVVCGFDLLAPAGRPRPAEHVALDILPVKPGGPAEQYAAYTPTTVLTVAAQGVVTVTIRNFDLAPSPLPAGSPYMRVQGTVGGVAYVDGTAYSALDRSMIAHTFTVPQLHLNVPIPGVAADGKSYVTVQFRVRTGKPGVYSWRCFAPCGDGPEGESGPMADDRYMRGTLVVEA